MDAAELRAHSTRVSARVSNSNAGPSRNASRSRCLVRGLRVSWMIPGRNHHGSCRGGAQVCPCMALTILLLTPGGNIWASRSSAADLTHVPRHLAGHTAFGLPWTYLAQLHRSLRLDRLVAKIAARSSHLLAARGPPLGRPSPRSRIFQFPGSGTTCSSHVSWATATAGRHDPWPPRGLAM